MSRLCACVPTAVGLAGCQIGVMDPQGPVGEAERTILLNAVAIMLAIVVPVILVTLAFAWWFRSSNAKARRRPDWAYSGRIELVTWSVPLLTITFLGGIAWIGSHRLDPAEPVASRTEPLDVQVISLDWKWLFIYPRQSVASINRLVVPVGTPVRFTLTSASVWNAFFVPQLGSMIYTMNGMATRLNLQADREGTFPGLSTHLSGDGFADMRFEVRSVSGEAFDAWVRTAQGAGATLDRAAYGELARQGVVPAATYRAVDLELFHDVVSQRVSPGSGPAQQVSPPRVEGPRTDPASLDLVRTGMPICTPGQPIERRSSASGAAPTLAPASPSTVSERDS